MRLLFSKLGVGVVICSALTARVKAADPQPGSVSNNDKNSTLTITSIDAASGVVTATFATGVACGVRKEWPLAGVFNQGAFNFAVNVQECASATS